MSYRIPRRLPQRVARPPPSSLQQKSRREREGRSDLTPSGLLRGPLLRTLGCGRESPVDKAVTEGGQSAGLEGREFPCRFSRRPSRPSARLFLRPSPCSACSFVQVPSLVLCVALSLSYRVSFLLLLYLFFNKETDVYLVSTDTSNNSSAIAVHLQYSF